MRSASAMTLASAECSSCSTTRHTRYIPRPMMGHPGYRIRRLPYGTAGMSSTEFYTVMSTSNGTNMNNNNNAQINSANSAVVRNKDNNNSTQISSTNGAVVRRRQWTEAQIEAMRCHLARLARDGNRAARYSNAQIAKCHK